MYEYPEELGKVSEDTLYNMIQTNVTATTMMTRLLVNDMKLRKKGVIVNVSSGFALHPAPLASVYAATKVFFILYFIGGIFLFEENYFHYKVFLLYLFHLKIRQSYVKNFTMALQYECKPYGIDVQLLSPYFVRTKLHSYSASVMAGNFFIPDVETYVRSAVFTLGKTDETTGYWPHAIQVSLFR